MQRLKQTLLLCLVATIPVSLAAAMPSALGGETPEAGATPLERALSSITADQIRADLSFLASDEMKGRDTPSPEQRIAARFIAARLARLGFQEGAQDGWFWNYEMPQISIDTDASHLAVGDAKDGLKLRLGEDYAFSTRAMYGLEVYAKSIIFAGTMSEGDREGLDLENRWVLVRASEESSRTIGRAARKAKAAGVIVIPGEGLDAAAMRERVESWGTKVGEGRMGRGRSPGKSLPYLYMTEGAANRLCEMGGHPTPKLGDVFELFLKETRVRSEGTTVGLENVVGIWPGSDPKLKEELIILSAHYDHVGVNAAGEVYNGADDNGSGTSAVLAVAEALSVHGPMRRSVMVMWVSGEEKGLLGSAAWTKDPYLPDGLRPVLNINIDMVGRNGPKSLLITPTKEHDAHNGLTRLAQKWREAEGFDELGSADAYWGRSDHANFSRHLEIPVAFLFSDVHEDYHKITDTVEKIDYDKIRRVSRLVVRMLDGLQDDELKID